MGNDNVADKLELVREIASKVGGLAGVEALMCSWVWEVVKYHIDDICANCKLKMLQ